MSDPNASSSSNAAPNAEGNDNTDENANPPAANAENQTAEGNNTGDWENFSSMDWESQNWDGNVFFAISFMVLCLNFNHFEIPQFKGKDFKFHS